MQTNTDTEFEAKFYPVEPNVIRTKLQEIGATLEQPERLMRMQVFNKHLNPNIDCDYIRVRDEGDKVTMSAKTHAKAEGNLADQKEINIIVSDFETAVALLEKAGLVKGDYQEKLRETWTLDDAEIVIDTWPSLEPYVEVEAPSEEKVRVVAEKLGLSWEDRIITSVMEIYSTKYGLSRDEVQEKIRYSTFECPPF